MDFNLRERTILLTIGGSRAYGIHLPTSDVDVKGVGIATKPYYYGYLQKWEQAEGDNISCFVNDSNPFTKEEMEAITSQKLEGTVYELQKFMALAADANPNILDVLFCRDEEVRVTTKLGRLLRENRNLFVSAKAKHTFSGYAASQLKRIEGHRAWLLNPPTAPPTRAEYGLPDHTLLPADHLAVINATVQKQLDSWEFDFSKLDDAEIIHVTEQVRQYMTETLGWLGYPDPKQAHWLAAARKIGLDENLIYIAQREREYEAASRYWKQYQEWKRNRNESRAALEAKYGYDTKHAGHLVRLLRMGREIMTTGTVHVWRGAGGPNDAEEIRAIRNGAWKYEDLIEWARKEDAELHQLYISKQYSIPSQPNRKAIDRLCIEMIETALSNSIG